MQRASVDWPRVILITVNVPFLILLHAAFIAHVLCTLLFWLAVWGDGRRIWLTIKAEYVKLVVALFKNVDID